MISWLGSFGGLGRAGRRTNVALLVVLVGAAATGVLAFAAGTAIPARLATVAHGLFGLAVVLLVPWKTVIVRRSDAASREPRAGCADRSLHRFRPRRGLHWIRSDVAT